MSDNKNEIEEISVYDLYDTKQEPDGYYMKTVPDISAKNIQILMDKINELVKEINRLKK